MKLTFDAIIELYSDDMSRKALINVNAPDIYTIDYYANSEYIYSRFCSNKTEQEVYDIAENYILGK